MRLTRPAHRGRPEGRNPIPLAGREPTAIRAAVVAAVTAVLHAAVVLGVVDHDTEKALTPVVDLIGLVAMVLWIRSGVTANAKVVARVSTSSRTVVAGDASTTPTGQVVELAHSGVLAPVDPRLVA